MTRQIPINLIVVILLAVTLLYAGDWPYRQELNREVNFWIQVFTHYHSNQYIFHDSENPALIYRIVTFDTSVSSRQREKQVRRIKKKISRRLFRLARNLGHADSLTAFDRYVLKQLGEKARPVELRVLSRQVRAQQGMLEPFRDGVRRALAYLPYLREIFREEGLPEELCYLPHVESSFNIHARSHAGAVGMWQFMRSTGRLYMKVNRIIDERRDPFISTRAAAKLLKYNYQELEDWALALTAYNFGVAGMRRAKKQVRGDYLKIRQEFRHRRFGFAARNFYPEFLAVVEIMRHLHHYFPNVQPIPLPGSVQYRLKRAVKLPRLARMLNIPLNTLKKLNPAYTYRVWRGWNDVPKGYWIRLPMEGVNFTVLAPYVEEIPLLAKAEMSKSVHPASPSQSAQTYLPYSKTLPELVLLAPDLRISPAQKTTEPVAEIEENSESGSGQAEKLAVAPGGGEPVLNKTRLDNILRELTPVLTPRGEWTEVFIHETLGHFAEWLHISVRRLRQLNDMGQRTRLYMGQKLRLDFSRVSPEQFTRARLRYHQQILKSYLNEKLFVNIIEYEVNSGESVWNVARIRYGVPFELVAYLNGNRNLSRIKAGDILKIPVLITKHTSEETL